MRALNLFDAGAQFEMSLLGVLLRELSGEDPIVLFNVIAQHKGFKQHEGTETNLFSIMKIIQT